jgi:hypothetical protein
MLLESKTPARKHMGRPKKIGGRKLTLWVDDINREMLRLYAERNFIDMTSALNMILRQTLSAAGVLEEATQIVQARKAQKENPETQKDATPDRQDGGKS